MPAFVIKLLTKEQPIQTRKSNRWKSHDQGPDFRTGTAGISGCLPVSPVPYWGIQAADVFLERRMFSALSEVCDGYAASTAGHRHSKRRREASDVSKR